MNDAAQASPEAQFADANRSKIVSGITGKLLPDGGSMQLTLDPANLGPMQVRVEMKNGVMSASFETSNDQASKLLSHSLGDLKTAPRGTGRYGRETSRQSIFKAGAIFRRLAPRVIGCRAE